jgi:hypothetical protein
LGEIEEQILGAGLPEIERDALLVARVDLPEQ